MAISYAAPPDGAERLAGAGLDEVTRTARLKTAGGASLTTSAPDQVTLSAPHELHNIGLDALVARRPLADSPTIGWRYLVQTQAGTVASSEVAADAGGQPTVFAQLNEGPFVESTARSLREVVGIPQVEAGNFEVRMLRIPAIYVMALWLKDLDGGADLVVPLDPAPDFLEAGRAYTEEEFLGVLESPARQRLEFDDSPQD
jgi:hypothetical protein